MGKERGQQTGAGMNKAVDKAVEGRTVGNHSEFVNAWFALDFY
jgi:hypothetical protein